MRTTTERSLGSSPAGGTVLFVDDEYNILRAVERAVKTNPLRLFAVQSGERALEVLSAQPVDIIISDYRMPGMDGLTLLRKVKDDYPTVHRMILSGYIDEPAVFRALGSGLAATFFAKPWDDEQLLAKLRHVMQVKAVLTGHLLLELVNTVDHLPTLPALYLELTRQIENESSLAEISDTVAKDPSATTVVLHIANSAYYGSSRPRPITALKDAIQNVGLEHVKDVVFAISLIRANQWTSRQLDHILAIFDRALLVDRYLTLFHERLSGERLPTRSGASARTAAILYDIGKIILLEYYPERFQAILERSASSGESFYEAELSLGLEGRTHCEIGAFFLDWWNMPDELVEISLLHHRSEGEAGASVAATVGYLDRLFDAMTIARRSGQADFSPFVRGGVSMQMIIDILQEIPEPGDGNRLRRWFGDEA